MSKPLPTCERDVVSVWEPPDKVSFDQDYSCAGYFHPKSSRLGKVERDDVQHAPFRSGGCSWLLLGRGRNLIGLKIETSFLETLAELGHDLSDMVVVPKTNDSL